MLILPLYTSTGYLWLSFSFLPIFYHDLSLPSILIFFNEPDFHSCQHPSICRLFLLYLPLFHGAVTSIFQSFSLLGTYLGCSWKFPTWPASYNLSTYLLPGLDFQFTRAVLIPWMIPLKFTIFTFMIYIHFHCYFNSIIRSISCMDPHWHLSRLIWLISQNQVQQCCLRCWVGNITLKKVLWNKLQKLLSLFAHYIIAILVLILINDVPHYCYPICTVCL